MMKRMLLDEFKMIFMDKKKRGNFGKGIQSFSLIFQKANYSLVVCLFLAYY